MGGWATVRLAAAAGLFAALRAAELRTRVLELPAMGLARERARIMWALAVDDRPAGLSLALGSRK